MYKVILIPLENSPADQAILDHIRPLAKLMNSRLVLVHVADGFAARNQDQLNLEDSEEMIDDRAYLEQRSGELARDGFEVSWRLACGSPAGEILAAAEKESCDLIAMATHGHRMVKDIILGSVANDVRHRTHIPVLMVRSQIT
jgi:nucleotide-binding universal stress UspA family protein